MISKKLPACLISKKNLLSLSLQFILFTPIFLERSVLRRRRREQSHQDMGDPLYMFYIKYYAESWWISLTKNLPFEMYEQMYRFGTNIKWNILKYFKLMSWILDRVNTIPNNRTRNIKIWISNNLCKCRFQNFTRKSTVCLQSFISSAHTPTSAKC